MRRLLSVSAPAREAEVRKPWWVAFFGWVRSGESAQATPSQGHSNELQTISVACVLHRAADLLLGRVARRFAAPAEANRARGGAQAARVFPLRASRA
jgi:hypothetical protein